MGEMRERICLYHKKEHSRPLKNHCIYFIVMVEFEDNYTGRAQDEVQSAYWN